MVCAPVRSIIPSLKLGDNLRTGSQTMFHLSHVIGVCQTLIFSPRQKFSIFQFHGGSVTHL